MSKKKKWVYCDKDPRDQGVKYWTPNKKEKEFITATDAFRLTMYEGWGLQVVSE